MKRLTPKPVVTDIRENPGCPGSPAHKTHPPNPAGIARVTGMYPVRGYVKVIATGATGRVEERHEGSSKYLVEFNRNFSTRQWLTESELVGVSPALFILRYHSSKLFYVSGRCIAFVFPERLWYPAALCICRLQTFILRPLIALSPYRKDPRRHIIVSWLLNSWLRQLSNLGRPFPIPIRIEGDEAIREAFRDPHGTIICSVHLPLVHLILRSLVEMNLRPAAVIAGETEMRNQKIRVWGIKAELPGIVSGSHVLLRARRELCRGGAVFALVDTDLGDSLRPNIFRLIRIAEARAVFAIPELLPSGEILVRYSVPPDPFCLSDLSILSNVQALAYGIDRVFKAPLEPQKSPEPAAELHHP